MAGNYLDLMIVFTTLLLSVICILSGSTLRLFYHREVPLEHLGWGTLIAAIWNFSFRSRQSCLFHNLVSATSIFPISEYASEKAISKAVSGDGNGCASGNHNIYNTTADRNM